MVRFKSAPPLLSNFIPACFFASLALIHFFRFSGTRDLAHLTSLLFFFQLLLVSIFFVLRRGASRVSKNVWDIFLSFGGTFLPFFFSRENEKVHPAGLGLQIIGSCLSLMAVAYLGRAFGILPAHRGIRTQGPYRFVRHPLYASYQLANIGYVLNHPQFYNAAIGVITFTLQILRIFREEKLLRRDPAYTQYARKVPWRFIPFVF